MTDPTWNRILRTLRVACPLAAGAAAVVGALAWNRGMPVAAGVDACLCVVNLALASVQWFVFKLR